MKLQSGPWARVETDAEKLNVGQIATPCTPPSGIIFLPEKSI